MRSGNRNISKHTILTEPFHTQDEGERKNSRDKTRHDAPEHGKVISWNDEHTSKHNFREKNCENLLDVYLERFHRHSVRFVGVIVSINMKFIVFDKLFVKFYVNVWLCQPPVDVWMDVNSLCAKPRTDCNKNSLKSQQSRLYLIFHVDSLELFRIIKRAKWK